MGKKIKITESQLQEIIKKNIMEQYPYQDYEETTPQHEPDMYDDENGPGQDTDFSDSPENDVPELEELLKNLGSQEDPFTIEEIIEMYDKTKKKLYDNSMFFRKTIGKMENLIFNIEKRYNEKPSD